MDVFYAYVLYIVCVIALTIRHVEVESIIHELLYQRPNGTTRFQDYWRHFLEKKYMYVFLFGVIIGFVWIIIESWPFAKKLEICWWVVIAITIAAGLILHVVTEILWKKLKYRKAKGDLT